MSNTTSSSHNLTTARLSPSITGTFASPSTLEETKEICLNNRLSSDDDDGYEEELETKTNTDSSAKKSFW